MNKSLLKEKADEINKIIYKYFPVDDNFNVRIASAVRYSVEVGGKRLRPLLMQETYKIFSDCEFENETLHVFMAAIEFIHTYSLVHDDLPAMDDDLYRRGNLTTHAKYGEAFGVLAGDALLNRAFEIIAEHIDSLSDPGQIKRAVHSFKILAHKSGIFGMVGGQCLDVESEKNSDFESTTERLEYIYLNKTAALLEASVMIGAVLAGASNKDTAILEKAARCVGMAFQIKDDILDITGTTEILGKPVGSDEKNSKKTYASFVGVEKADELVKEYTYKALELIENINCDTVPLKDIFVYLINREM